MNRVIILAVIMAAAEAAPAQAVDLVNRDRVARDVVVNRSDGTSETLTAKPKQKISDICNACVVITETSSVEATGSVTVMIEGGKVSITGKP